MKLEYEDRTYAIPVKELLDKLGIKEGYVSSINWSGSENFRINVRRKLDKVIE